jgi:octaprenyl-diphosphate synthase
MHLGIAFQLIDDVLDYSGNTKILGKNVGDDLAEGKSTLPLIYAMENSSNSHRNLIQKSLQIEELSQAMLEDVIGIVRSSGGLDYTRNLAKAEAKSALQCLQTLTDSDYRQSLEKMVDFSINRKG